MGKSAQIRIQNKSTLDVTVEVLHKNRVHDRGLDNIQGRLAAGAQFPSNQTYETIEGKPRLRIEKDGYFRLAVRVGNKQRQVNLSVDRSHWWHSAKYDENDADAGIVLCTDVDDDDDQILIGIYNDIPTEQWMEHMADKLADKPLCCVALPGTHDSATYAWNKDLGASPDSDLTTSIQEKLDGKLGAIGSRINDRILGMVYSRMCKCQDKSIAEQLNQGIRYLDLRVAWHEDGGFYTCHGVYCVPLKQVLEQIAAFLSKHAKEIVILDFNHFYELQEEHHAQLRELILDKLGNQAAIRPGLEPNSTVQEYWDKGSQAVIFYHHDATQQASEGKLWYRGAIRSPWPNKNETKELHDNLKGHIQERDRNKFFVLQGILTPDGELIKEEILENKGMVSIQSIASQVSRKVVSWVEDEWKGECHNVVIVDFFEDCSMVPAIINLNH